MEVQLAQFINRGMNQDISVSKATNEFAFKNTNIRITAVNDNTLLSITNEKLPKDVNVILNIDVLIPNRLQIVKYEGSSSTYIELQYTAEENVIFTLNGSNTLGINKGNKSISVDFEVGTITILSPTNGKGNKYLYYTDSIPEDNYITQDFIPGKYLGHAILNEQLVLFTKDSVYDYIIVLEYKDNSFVGKIKYKGDLNFSLDNPIETLPYYESEDIQKVYWVDGLNQPRVINIATDNIVERLNTQFNFNPSVTKFPNVTITKEYQGIGLFPSGVIQYFISYYNKFGAETGIVWSSNLQYVTEYNRGVSPSDNVVCGFKIDVNNIDTTYEYMRVYSMQRTSLNNTPICRIVADVNINKSKNLTVLDTNANTETIDPTQLLFLGGDTFIASTLTQKDDVLFLGDLEINNTVVPQKVKDLFPIPDGETKSPYLTVIYTKRAKSDNKTFKVGEWYRVGIQFQDVTTKWTIPIFVGDIQIPQGNLTEDNLPSIVFDVAGLLQANTDASEILSAYKNFRLVMVEPDNSTRNVLAQGIVNPTVFNAEQRVNKTGPYAIGSWVSRPINGKIHYKHLSPLGNDYSGSNESSAVYTNLETAEIQNMLNDPPIESVKYYAISFQKESNRSVVAVIAELKDRELPIDNNNFPSRIKQVINYRILIYASTQDYYVNANYLDKLKEQIQKYVPGIEINLDKDVWWEVVNSGAQEVNTPVEGVDGWYWGAFNVAPADKAIVEKKASIYSIISHTELGYPDYYTDSSIVTLNSPDLENTANLIDNAEGLKFRITGIVPINSVNVETLIETSTSGNTLYADTTDYKENSPFVNYPIYRDASWDGAVLNTENPVNYYMYLWNKKGSIVGQTNNSTHSVNGEQEQFTYLAADLKHKIIANKFNGGTIKYFNIDALSSYAINPIIFNSDIIQSRYLKVLGNSEVYQGNYNNIIYYGNSQYKVFWKTDTGDVQYSNTLKQYDPVEIKFNKPIHAVFSLEEDGFPLILPYIAELEDAWNLQDILYANNTTLNSDTQLPWLKTDIYYKQHTISKDTLTQEVTKNTNYLYIGEIYRDKSANDLYGESTQNNLEKHNWIPISDAHDLSDTSKYIMGYTTRGDTYYQRWECLNTVPSTEEDLNSVVDIVSFMVETHINLEGRYDKNKDSLNILNARETNFNLINSVYSQTNNYFTYNILDEKFNATKYENQVAFSLTKTPTSEIDTWCNITLASSFNLNGLYGKLTKLINVNDSILAFQDKALSVINFNNRTALSTESGVPIEIANSGKVNGYFVISSNIGCQNKQSICQASSGVYFIDDYNKTMYGFNREGLSNISSKGMSMWFKKNLTGKEKIFYDSLTNDVYVTNANDCLVFNEGLQAFTSFMDYNNINALFNFNGYSLMLDKDEQDAIIPKKMFSGDYTNNYSIEYKINPEPLVDKTFGNIEFIADCIGEQEDIDSDSVQYYHEIKPFDLLQVWNEYQRGTTDLHTARFRYPNSEKKFRIWRVDIPRDESNHRDRIRNPWIYLRLSKSEDLNHTKMVFHNLLVRYYK